MPRLLLILSAMLAALVSAAPARAQQRTLHEERSLYRNIVVTQTGDERCMLFRARRGLGRESCKYMSRPERFVFEYASLMFSSLYVNTAPRRALIIGLGGGTLPTALQEMSPETAIDVVEIDPAVERIAQIYFDYKPGPRTRTFIQDGRVFVKRAVTAGEKYDLVMLDAFEADYIPEHMLTKEFLEEVKSIMTPNGVLVANTFSASALYDHESTTYQSVFGTFYNLKYSNRIILTRLGGLPSMDEVRANVPKWEAELRRRGATPEFVLRIMTTNIDWDPAARILTDQYSPSNVLNALPRGN